VIVFPDEVEDDGVVEFAWENPEDMNSYTEILIIRSKTEPPSEAPQDGFVKYYVGDTIGNSYVVATSTKKDFTLLTDNGNTTEASKDSVLESGDYFYIIYTKGPDYTWTPIENPLETTIPYIPGSGSCSEQAPAPQTVSATYNPDDNTILLVWTELELSELPCGTIGRYDLYASTIENFTVSELNKIGESTTDEFVFTDFESNTMYYFKIRAVNTIELIYSEVGDFPAVQTGYGADGTIYFNTRYQIGRINNDGSTSMYPPDMGTNITDVVEAPDGTIYVAAGQPKHTVYHLSAEGGKVIREFRGFPFVTDPVAIEISPDGNYLYVGNGNSCGLNHDVPCPPPGLTFTVSIIDTRSGEKVGQIGYPGARPTGDYEPGLFFGIRDMYLSDDGSTLYIADYNSETQSQVVKVSVDGTNWQRWGDELTFNDQSAPNDYDDEDLYYPIGVGLSPDEDYFYVVDYYRDRILKIDNLDDWSDIDDWSTYVTSITNGAGTFCGTDIDNKLYRMDVFADGTLVVAHYGSHKLFKIDGDLTYGSLECYGDTSSWDPGKFSYPFNVRLSADESMLYVVNGNSNNRLVRFSSTFPASPTQEEWENIGVFVNGLAKYQLDLGTCGYTTICGKFDFDAAREFIYIADANHHRVIKMASKLDGSQYSYVGRIDGAAGSGVGEFNNPSSVHVDGSNVYITDAGNDRIVRTNTDLDAASVWETVLSSGDDPQQMNYPLDLMVVNNEMWVMDQYYNTTLQSSVSGLNAIVAFGNNGGSFSFDPMVNWKDYTNYDGVRAGYQQGFDVYGSYIYVTDAQNHLIWRLNAADMNTDTNTNNKVVTKYNGSCCNTGTGEWEFDRPFGLDVFNGLIYIADNTNKRIVSFPISVFDTATSATDSIPTEIPVGWEGWVEYPIGNLNPGHVMIVGQ